MPTLFPFRRTGFGLFIGRSSLIGEETHGGFNTWYIKDLLG